MGTDPPGTEAKRPHIVLNGVPPVSAAATTIAAAVAAAADAAAMPPPNAVPMGCAGSSQTKSDESSASQSRPLTGTDPASSWLCGCGTDLLLNGPYSASDELPSPWFTSSGSAAGILPSPALLPSGAMATLVVGMSPALLPTTAVAINLEDLPVSARSSEQHFFPLDSAARKPFGSPAGAPSSPAEGGIMMLSDLQEAQASRETLDSAFRDYGVSLVCGGQAPYRSGRGTPEPPSRQASRQGSSQPSLLSQLNRSVDESAYATAALPQLHSYSEEDSSPPAAMLDGAEPAPAGASRVPRLFCSGRSDSDGADGGASVFMLSNGLRAPAAAPSAPRLPAAGGGDGAGCEVPSEPTEGAVRLAVVTEMASASLTQSTVAQQAGISQPALCAWLAASSCKAGKESGHLATRLSAWLGSRSTGELAPRAASEPAQIGGRGSPVCAPAPPAALPAAAPAPTRRAKRGGKEAAVDETSFEASEARGQPSACDDAGASSSAAEGKSRGGGRMRLTEQHLYVAYVWYLNERERHGHGGAGEEEHFCFRCKDGGDVMLCDFDNGGCSKSYHVRCCNLKAVPEGHWECPRHKCGKCGASPARAAGKHASRDAPSNCSRAEPSGRADPTGEGDGRSEAGRSDAPPQGRGKRQAGRPPPDATSTLWPCRTCPQTFCERCLPERVLHVGAEVRTQPCRQRRGGGFKGVIEGVFNREDSRSVPQLGGGGGRSQGCLEETGKAQSAKVGLGGALGIACRACWTQAPHSLASARLLGRPPGVTQADAPQAPSPAHLLSVRQLAMKSPLRLLPLPLPPPQIICLSCQGLLRSDLSLLQRDLLHCDPDQFAIRAGRP